MNKYERNIQQIRNKGESAEMYFLHKTQEECLEMIQITNKIIELEEEGIDWRGTTWEDNLYEESADVINCVAEYMPRLLTHDLDRIREIKANKADRGYERGKNE